MRLLLITTLLLPALALAQARKPAIPPPKKAMTTGARTTLQQALAAHIHETREGDVEDPEQREIVYGDVDGDGVRDAVVLYTLEQVRGNGWGQVLAVFLHKKGVTGSLLTKR
jgi:hypothetical protein